MPVLTAFVPEKCRHRSCILGSLALIIARNEYELLHYLIPKFLLRSSLPFPSVASVFTVEMLSFFKEIRLTASGIATLKDLILA